MRSTQRSRTRDPESLDLGTPDCFWSPESPFTQHQKHELYNPEDEGQLLKTFPFAQVPIRHYENLILFLIFLSVAITVRAQVVYNSRTTYDVAHPANYVVDFNNYTPAPTQYADATAATPAGNVSFDAIPSSNNIEFLQSSTFGISQPGNQFLTDSLLITLPANSFSFGTDIIRPSGTVPEPYQFTIYSGSTVLTTRASSSVSGAYTFFGYDSATSPITSVAVQIGNGVGSPTPVLDNFTIVPEPTTCALLAAAAGLLVARRRKKVGRRVSA